jgi:rhodanese-related sulfurtransferase
MNVPSFSKTTLGHELGVLAILATSALCIGLVINQFRDVPMSFVYQSKETRLNEAVLRIRTAACPAGTMAPQDGPISLSDFRVLVETKTGIILDARPEIFYRLGHVPGAVSLPRDDFENAYGKLNALLSHQDQQLAVYCSGSSCEDSDLVRTALHKLGYTHVLLFKGGWDEWTEAGLPQEK